MFPFFFRREVYSILQAEGILLPRYAILNRDPNNPKGRVRDFKQATFCHSAYLSHFSSIVKWKEYKELIVFYSLFSNILIKKHYIQLKCDTMN